MQNELMLRVCLKRNFITLKSLTYGKKIWMLFYLKKTGKKDVGEICIFLRITIDGVVLS